MRRLAYAIALLAELGWLLHAWFPAGQWGRHIPMAPSTALALFLLSSAVVSQARWPAHRRSPMTAAGLRFAAIVVLGAAACGAQTQPAGALASKNILILDAHEFGTLASAEIDQGLRAALRNAGLANSRLHFEFLDLRRYPDPRYRHALGALLRLKYESTKFDLIMAIAPPSLSVVLDNPDGRHPLFEGVPVIGVAVLEERISSTKEHPLILITDHTDVRATVKTALNLLPGTKHILVVCGVSEYNRQIEREAEPALREWAGRLDISWLNNLPLDDMLGAVSKAPPHSFVLYLGVTTDVTGRGYAATDVAEALGRVSAAPVFGISDTYVRMGLVGGFVKEYAEEGREAGRVAVRILKGEMTLWPAPPPIRASNLALFDWRQMKRWGLDEAKLPKGSVVENRPVTIWSQHPWYVIGTVTFIVLESLLIVALVLDVRRRMGVQAELHRNQSLLQAVLDGTPDPIYLKDRECRMVMANPATLRALGKPAEQVLGKPSRSHIDDPEGGRAVLENDRRIMETGVTESVEETLPGPGGLRVFLSTKSPYRDPEGRVIGLIGVSRDITERKVAEEALRESESQYRELFESSSDALFLIDTETGQIVEANTMASEIYGYDPDELLTKKAADMSAEPEDTHQRIQEARTKPGQVFRIPLRLHRRKDGTVFPVEITARSFIREGRTVLLVSSRDITERKRVEEALRESNRLLSDSQSTGHVGSWSWDVTTDTSKLRWSPETYRLHGVSPDTFVPSGETLLSLIHVDDRVAMQTWLGACLAGEEPPALEFRTVLPDGSVRYILGRGNLARDAGAKPIRMTGICQDVTDRKRAEEALRESERQLRTVLETVSLVGVMLDRQGNITLCNDSLLALTGWKREEVLHGDWFELFLPCEIRGRIRQEVFLDTIDTGEVPVHYQNEIITRKGERRLVDWNNTVIRDTGGQIVGLAIIGEDITDRKRAEEKAVKLQAQFHQAQKMESIGRLAGGVAHDFNNLLTVINGYSQMLLAKLRAGDPLRDSLEQIHKAGERAAGLTRQLLAFSRKQVLEPRRLDVNRVVEDMRPMLERLVGDDVEMRVAVDAKGGRVHVDPHQLEQVVMNLVVNARDAMPGVGKLLVETANVEWDENYAQSHPEARAGRFVMLAVTDTGVGMDEETKSRIFEPFFTTKGLGKGTGLGLSMVQGIVAQSGGYVEVHSEKGMGTTFKIYLPALTEVLADAGSPAPVPALGGKETVLVVEDQEEVRGYAVTVLKAYGYQVVQAADAGEALLLCEHDGRRIDLLLTDVVMPHVSGPELAGRLAALRPGIKVLFMSGYTDNAIAHHGVLEEGAQFIQKPFSPEDLARKVRAVLGPAAQAAARILVADDEAGVRGFLRKVLEDGGYEVMEAENGRQALNAVRKGRVDLVITDLVMPEQEGIETIQALRRDVPGVRIIAISGAFGGQFLKTAQMLGADAVLNKPVSAELLLAEVAEVLKTRR